MRVVFFVLAGIGALLAALMLIPFRIRLRIAANLRGGHGELRMNWLFVRIRLPIRARILDEPILTCDFMQHNGSVLVRLKKTEKIYGKNPFVEALADAFKLLRFEVLWTVGIRDAPAACALLCGVLDLATRVILTQLPLVVPDGVTVVSVQPYTQFDALRLNLEGMASLRLTDSIKSIIRAQINKARKK